MLLLGLTGSIATGKSTVSQILSSPPYNLPIIDADKVARQVVEPGTSGYNKIVHPAVRGEMYKQMLYAYLRGNWAVVLDVPLLFESGWEPLCGTIMVVAVKDAAVQMQRLRARDEHLTEEDAKNRVASQWDVRDKAERCLRRGEKAGVVVWNDGDQEDLKKEIDRVMSVVKEGSPQWWAWMLLLFPPLGLMSGGWSYVRSWYIKRQWEQEKTREKAKL